MKTRGYTLIELVVVVVIAGILVAMTVTRLDYLLPKYRLRGAAREVGAIMKQARVRAASTGREVYVEFDLRKGTYWLLVAFPKLDDAGREVEPRSFEHQPVLRQVLPGDSGDVEFVDVIFGVRDKVDSGTARLRVSPFGSTNHVIVNLRGWDGREMAVKMNGFTGNLSFYEEHKDADELLEDREM